MSTSGIHRRDFLAQAGKAALAVTATASADRWLHRGCAGEIPGARRQLDHLSGARRFARHHRADHPALSREGRDQDHAGLCPRRRRPRGAHQAHTAKPDGYEMMTESAPGAAIDEFIGRANFKASDFMPIYGWSVVGWQICVKKDSPIRTFKNLVDECKKRRVVIGTIGRGASSHIQLAAIQKQLNLQFGVAAFRGLRQGLSGRPWRPHRCRDQRAGSGSRMQDSLHFLAVTGEHREKALPDVPTLKEHGFAVTPIDQIWYAMATPKTPDDRIAALSAAFEKAFRIRRSRSRWKRPANPSCFSSVRRSRRWSPSSPR